MSREGAPLTVKRFYTLRALKYASLSLALLVVVLVAWMYIEPRTLWVDRSVVASPDLPREFDGLKVVFAADVHAGSWLGPGQVDRMVRRINELDPDIIILGGDYVAGGPDGYPIAYPRLRRLKASIAKVAVLGNHDLGRGSLPARQGLKAAGFRMLDNDNVRIGRRTAWIRVAGTRFAWMDGDDVTQAARDISQQEYAILVAHNPDAFADGLPVTRGAFDLALGAHTHGGQATLLGLWAPLVSRVSAYGDRYRGGWLVEEDVPILVTRGVGVSVFPARFMAPPQIHLIELRRGTADVQP